MYPPIKNQIISLISDMHKELQDKESSLEELKCDNKAKKSQIKSLEKERDTLLSGLREIESLMI